jgi:hypothetical protein
MSDQSRNVTSDRSIRIRPDWDAVLTYRSLNENSARHPVFVGRETLIAPLVAEITEPNKCGTYLISGYRGTGKTTLLIEALRRAQKELANEFTLFPVVLNVSEVSASLGDSSESTPVTLHIEPRRLLIALIRQIRDEIGRLPKQTEKTKQLAQNVDYVYEKSTAAKFSVASRNGTETTRSRVRELALALDDKSVLKTLAVVAGGGAIAIEAAAWARPLGWLHAAALALGSVFTVGLGAAYKLSYNEKSTSSKQTALEHDNSLQQLETDLKDILGELKENSFRTVVVMEELDKLNDDDGSHLAAVIRYFKNLFTQAPALFFFVTDKSYFDIVASAIKRARRKRSYAVEHTFFTHRIFVGRPTTEECLNFIEAIALDPADCKAIRDVMETLGKPSQIANVDPLGRFVRVVLFNAANHMFDLKNELRRFARNEEHVVGGGKLNRVSSFVIDDRTLPEEQQALAVFMDLIVEKFRSFEIKGGRAYANETLADSLFAVFNELGSNQPQKIDSFLPATYQATIVDGNAADKNTTDVHAKEPLLLDEQLDLSEAARVREAVHSLIGDLERGRALQSRDTTANTFTWRDDAARAFRYVRQLQKHEENLIGELQRYSSLANALTAGGDPPVAHGLATMFEKRVVELRDLPEPLTADAAAAEIRQILDAYGEAVTTAFQARLTELAPYGFTFEQITKGLGGSLHLVKPSSGDPRLHPAAPRGAVLIALGEIETLVEDVFSFIKPTAPSYFPLNRAALVHVIHTTGNAPNEAFNREYEWNVAFRNRGETPDLFTVDVVPLVGAGEAEEKLTNIQRTAAAIAAFGAWSRLDSRPYQPIPKNTPELTAALKEWKSSDSQIFHVDATPTPSYRFFGERDELEPGGQVVMNLNFSSKQAGVFADMAISCALAGFKHAAGPPELWAPLGRWLLQSRRVILYVDWDAMFSWTSEDIVEALEVGARVIVKKSESLPPELLDFGIVTAPQPPPEEVVSINT